MNLGIAAKMKLANYSTHFVGKWDAGMVTPMHTPQGRGYDTSLHYFDHYTDYWNQQQLSSGCNLSLGIVDLWATDQPAYGLNGTQYEEFLFLDAITDIIQSHDPDQPLFLFYTPHIAHFPLQVPEELYNKFGWMTDDESECSLNTTYVYPGWNSSDTFQCRQLYVHIIA